MDNIILKTDLLNQSVKLITVLDLLAKVLAKFFDKCFLTRRLIIDKQVVSN